MKLGVTRQRLALHMRYDSWMYLVGILCMVVLLNITYTATAPRTPEDKLVEVYIASLGGMDEQQLSDLSRQAQQALSDQQEVRFSNVNTMEDYYADQLTVMLMAQQGNVFIIPASRFDSFALSGGFLPLDAYLQDGTLVVPEHVERFERGPGTDDNADVPRAIYGLDAGVLTGLMERGYVPMEERSVVCIPASTKNLKGSLDAVAFIYANWMQ